MSNGYYDTSKLAFEVKPDYNYSLSTEDNYRSDDHSFYGKYQHERSVLDYAYHKHYSKERQLLQDQVIDRFLNTFIRDKTSNLICASPLENWIVFTAGPMGAGKGHTMSWLASQDLFPMSAFVHVDPDTIRKMLPETEGYNAADEQTSGYLTQKEVGYISEIMTYDALNSGKNVLVDGSLRDARWYLQYFTDLRSKFPILRVAIINITAKIETVLARAKKRALVTGRTVPEDVILKALHEVPAALEILSPIADFLATFNNDDDSEPVLYVCSMKNRGGGDITWKLFYDYDRANPAEVLASPTHKHNSEVVVVDSVSGRSKVATTTSLFGDTLSIVNLKSRSESPKVDGDAAVSTPATVASADSGGGGGFPSPPVRRRGSTIDIILEGQDKYNEGSIHGVITEGITSNRLSIKKSNRFASRLKCLVKSVVCGEDGCRDTRDSHKDSPSASSVASGAFSSPQRPFVPANSPIQEIQKTPSADELSLSPLSARGGNGGAGEVRYLHIDFTTNQMQYLPDWKDAFREVWVMYCAMPSPPYASVPVAVDS